MIFVYLLHHLSTTTCIKKPPCTHQYITNLYHHQCSTYKTQSHYYTSASQLKQYQIRPNTIDLLLGTYTNSLNKTILHLLQPTMINLLIFQLIYICLVFMRSTSSITCRSTNKIKSYNNACTSPRIYSQTKFHHK